MAPVRRADACWGSALPRALPRSHALFASWAMSLFVAGTAAAQNGLFTLAYVFRPTAYVRTAREKSRQMRLRPRNTTIATCFVPVQLRS